MAKAVITKAPGQKLVSINRADSPTSKIINILPFRVKFIAIGLNAYGPNNPAPIGIAIIGYSNYVL